MTDAASDQGLRIDRFLCDSQGSDFREIVTCLIMILDVLRFVYDHLVGGGIRTFVIERG